ncbi:hypothetical protein EYF80_022969 [Liparis tanakae]|uniref:Uncharacterized protein n=1 Tax=Liparis tanakae TaxID=230148 RepID=A0A4Z2HLU6_9TELE|nr:hypothetical protein EYF80_022969 [Liparis tanakae]
MRPPGGSDAGWVAAPSSLRDSAVFGSVFKPVKEKFLPRNDLSPRHYGTSFAPEFPKADVYYVEGIRSPIPTLGDATCLIPSAPDAIFLKVDNKKSDTERRDTHEGVVSD